MTNLKTVARRRIVGRLVRLFAYLVWHEWVCGRPVAFHPTEVAWLTVKVIAGVPMGGAEG